MKTGAAQILVALVIVILLVIGFGVVKIPIFEDRVNVMCDSIFEEMGNEYFYRQVPDFCNDNSIAEFEALQTEVYECMVNTFSYVPITYMRSGNVLVPSNTINIIVSDYPGYLIEVAEDETHTYYENGYALYNKLEVGYYGFPSSVLKSNGVDEIHAEEHEMVHVFVQNNIDKYPGAWYSEGTAVYLSSRLKCSDKEIPDDWRVAIAGQQYERAVMGLPFKNIFEITGVYNGEIQVSIDPYIQGMMFFIGLERDYGCGVGCVVEIINTVRDEYGLDMSAYTIEEYEKIIVSPILEIIPQEDLKRTIEEVVGRDLTPLYEMLEIEVSS